jgi:hypothetical protein
MWKAQFQLRPKRVLGYSSGSQLTASASGLLSTELMLALEKCHEVYRVSHLLLSLEIILI